MICLAKVLVPLKLLLPHKRVIFLEVRIVKGKVQVPSKNITGYTVTGVVQTV